jgi:hypothetical protein
VNVRTTHATHSEMVYINRLPRVCFDANATLMALFVNRSDLRQTSLSRTPARERFASAMLSFLARPLAPTS